MLQKFKNRFFEFTTWPRNQKVTWLWRWALPTTSYYFAKFGGHRYCERADTWLYICYRLHDQKVSNFVDAVTQTMPYFQFQCQFQFQCLQITNIQPEPCAFKCCSFWISMQKRPDFNFQVYISLTIYLATIWLNKNASIHSLNKYI